MSHVRQHPGCMCCGKAAAHVVRPFDEDKWKFSCTNCLVQLYWRRPGDVVLTLVKHKVWNIKDEPDAS